jgi:hypothetical protein
MTTMKEKICRMAYRLQTAAMALADSLMLVLSILMIICVILTGCSSSSKVKKQVPVTPVKTSDDSIAQIQIKRGLSLFDGGHYAEAANHFEHAAKATGDESTVRSCFIAAAVCHLVANDKKGFVSTVDQLKRRYEETDFLLVTDRDARMKALIELSEKIQERSER